MFSGNYVTKSANFKSMFCTLYLRMAHNRCQADEQLLISGRTPDMECSGVRQMYARRDGRLVYVMRSQVKSSLQTVMIKWHKVT